MQQGIPITIPAGITNTLLIAADDGCLIVPAGATRFYPAHGGSIPAEAIRRVLDRAGQA